MTHPDLKDVDQNTKNQSPVSNAYWKVVQLLKQEDSTPGLPQSLVFYNGNLQSAMRQEPYLKRRDVVSYKGHVLQSYNRTN